MNAVRMMRRPQSVYPSRRDAWIELLIWIGVGATAVAALEVWRAPETLETKLVAAGFSLAAAALMLWLLYGTRYTLTDERLVIRSGPFRWRIALQAIHSVDPSRSLLSSPAVSLDRLRVRYGPSRRSILISPDDKERFLWDLATRAGLELVGDRIRRST